MNDTNDTAPDGRNETSTDDGLPILEGSIVGVVAWIVGYALTYVIVAPDVRDSALHRIIETFEGEPATYEMVGWVFYNAHLVDVVFQNVPILGSQTTSYIGGEDGFTVLLYLIPVGLLLAAGLALARYRGAADPTAGALVGGTVLPGYLLLSVAGVFLFEVTLGGASGAPDLLPAIVLAGIVFPVFIACAGGALGGFLERRSRESHTRERSTV